jgi:predicted acylesterase/phospholipase RssA
MAVRTALISLLCFLLTVPAAAQNSSAPQLPNPHGISLVLSGGAAKGFAHIGVLDVLDSAKVPINLIVGTSVGAAIGGLYAAGYTPKQLEQFVTTTNWEEILGLRAEAHRDELIMSQKDADRALLSLRFTGFFHPVLPQALSSGQRLTMLLNSMVLRAPEGVPQDFLRDLRVPFAAVTTDIVHGQQRVLTSGDLTEALRESATLPLTFSPLPQDSVILMDGGLLANIPVDIARQLGATNVVVSNATAPLRTRDELTTALDVADQVITLMMEKQYASQLTKANVIIAPAVNDRSNYDAQAIEQSIEAGRQAARTMLPTILQLLTTNSNGEPEPDTLLSTISVIRVNGGRASDTVLTFGKEYFGLPLLKNGSLTSLERQTVQYFRSAGFSLARIDSVVIDVDSQVVSLFVDRGHIGNVVVKTSSDESVPSQLVLSELPFSSGDIFRAQAADRAIKNLVGTGLYDYAILQIAYDTAWHGTQVVLRRNGASVPNQSVAGSAPTVVVTIHPRASNVVRLGVLADNEFGAQFSAELANENILGSGVEYSLTGSIGPLARNISFSLEAPRLFRSFALLEAQIYSGYIDINTYTHPIITENNHVSSFITDVFREARDFGFRIKAGGQIERVAALTGEIRSEKQEWFSLRESPRTVSTQQLSAFRAEIVIDSRNDASYPHIGTYLRAFIETGQPVAGGNPSYTKLYADFEQAIPASTLHTIIPRLRLGFGDVTLPRLEQFELGGMESFYGLNAFELRGKQMVAGSIAYQIAIPHALFFPTFVSFRYDLGATWAEPEAVKWRSLVDGIGAQVGLKTPLGLLRFGIGENFRFVQDEPHPLALNNPRFYFSVGSSI